MIAIALPFHLFLFSYAVFGPLHYLTELGWLDKKEYFIKSKGDFKYFVFFALFYTISVFIRSLPSMEFSKEWFQTLNPEGPVYSFLVWFKDIFKFITFSAFASAFIFMFVKSSFYRFILVALSVVIGLKLVEHSAEAMLYFGLFVPTIIHVSIFTLLFMWFGSRKSNSTWGYVSCVLLVLLFLSCIVLPESILAISGTISDKIVEIYKLSSFDFLNKRLAYVFGIFPQVGDLDLTGIAGKKIQILIAFAYTYHYLNWFVKTRVIKWHEVPKKRLMTIGIIWIISIALYFYNYKVGLLALLFLSMLHVFSEFPLNIITIKSLINFKPKN